MDTFNHIASAIFGVLLAPFGQEKNWSAWIDVILWSVGGGIVALLVYKYVSNQKGIARTKNDIKVHLLEVRLFKDDILGVFVATGKILAKNAVYLAHNLLPMVVMLVPMMAILVQLVSTHVITIRVGDEVLEKGLAVGGEPRRVPVMRTKSWEALLFPTEAPIPSGSAVHTAGFTYESRDLGWMPGGELGILLVFFGLSLLAGIALKGVFKVTL